MKKKNQWKKCFLLISGSEEDWYWSITAKINRNEEFENKGEIFVYSKEKHRCCVKEYYHNNIEKCRKRSREWAKNHPEKVLENVRKQIYRRKRKLGCHKISLPLNCEFDWHHVNENDVVAMSRWIHRAVSHEVNKNKLEGIVG